MSVTPTAYATGTQSATVGTEHFVSSPNVAGLFTFHVNLSNMAAGDMVELRVYSILLTGDSYLGTYIMSYSDAQPADNLNVVSVPIGNELTDTNSLRFSIKQTAGTSRDFKWKVLQY